MRKSAQPATRFDGPADSKSHRWPAWERVGPSRESWVVIAGFVGVLVLIAAPGYWAALSAPGRPREHAPAAWALRADAPPSPESVLDGIGPGPLDSFSGGAGGWYYGFAGLFAGLMVLKLVVFLARMVHPPAAQPGEKPEPN